jgi:hypothetical protein
MNFESMTLIGFQSELISILPEILRDHARIKICQSCATENLTQKKDSLIAIPHAERVHQKLDTRPLLHFTHSGEGGRGTWRFRA